MNLIQTAFIKDHIILTSPTSFPNLQNFKFPHLLFLLLISFGCRTTPPEATTAASREPEVEEAVEVAKVWPGHPVGFALLTSPPHQYVAYYDEDRQMTVAHRRLGEKSWTYQVLPERVGWDSHNYIAMALDAQGHLHVSGNLHGDPLKYFYASTPPRHPLSPQGACHDRKGGKPGHVPAILFRTGR